MDRAYKLFKLHPFQLYTEVSSLMYMLRNKKNNPVLPPMTMSDFYLFILIFNFFPLLLVGAYLCVFVVDRQIFLCPG